MPPDVLRPATLADALSVCANLRDADRAECLAASGIRPEYKLPRVVQEGGALAMIAPDGNVAGLCGIHPTLIPDYASVWMVATNAITRHRHLMLASAAAWLDEQHLQFPRIGNMVDARNALHVRWLATLGFRFTAVHRAGPQSLPFITFERTRPSATPSQWALGRSRSGLPPAS